MIKANELRIGNYALVAERNDFSFQVNGDSINNFSKGTLEIRPVPLTEEWMPRFGFSKHYRNEVYFEKNGFRIYYDSENGFHKVWDGIIVKYPFVHKLQNFYYEMKGEELTSQTPSPASDKK